MGRDTLNRWLDFMVVPLGLVPLLLACATPWPCPAAGYVSVSGLGLIFVMNETREECPAYHKDYWVKEKKNEDVSVECVGHVRVSGDDRSVVYPDSCDADRTPAEAHQRD